MKSHDGDQRTRRLRVMLHDSLHPAGLDVCDVVPRPEAMPGVRKRSVTQRRVVSLLCCICIGLATDLSAVGNDNYGVREEGQLSPELSSRLRILDSMFDESIRAENVIAVRRHAAILPENERFEYLAAQVLPSPQHAAIRVICEFTQTDSVVNSTTAGVLEQLGDEQLVSPVFDLLQTAMAQGRLAELRDRISRIPIPASDAQRKARLALLLLVYMEFKDEAATLRAGDELFSLVVKGNPQTLAEMWPETLAVWYAVKRFGGHLATTELLAYMATQKKDPSLPPGITPWDAHIAALHGLQSCLQPGQTPELLPATESSREWIPVVRSTNRTRGMGYPESMWHQDSHALQHIADHRDDYVFFRSPLTGEFEVEGEIGGRGVFQLMCGGSFCGPHGTQLTQVGSFRNSGRTQNLNPPFSRFDSSVRFRVVCRDGMFATSINGREVDRKPVSDSREPWIGLRVPDKYMTELRNVVVMGHPDIADAVLMSESTDLTGWLNYFNYQEGLAWRHIDTPGMTDGILGRRRDELDGTNCEALLRYQRPLVDDSSVEYEFFYVPEKVHTHPALDRLAFMLEADGVRIHRITDSPFDRSEIPPDNMYDEPQSRDGLSPLPLKPREWNHLKVSLMGDAFTLELNEQVVYRRVLEARNHRTFGLFHFADRTIAQVRNVIMRGEWPKSLPPAAEQQLADVTIGSLDIRREKLPVMFHQNFLSENFRPEFFGVSGHGAHSATANPSGFFATCQSDAEDSTAQLTPHFEMHGDFDLTASFQNFERTGAKDATVRIKVVVGPEELETQFLSQWDQQLFFRGGKRSAVPNGRPTAVMENARTASTSGRLRIARQGNVVTFAFAEGDSENFHIVNTQETSSASVVHGNLTLDIVASPETAASVLWTEFRINAERLQYFPPSNAPKEKAVYVMNMPEPRSDVPSDVPLWRQYCERRITEFEVSADGDNPPAVMLMQDPVAVSWKSDSANGLAYLWISEDGRPVAIGSVLLHGTGEDGLTEVNEFHSLCDGPLRMTSKGQTEWAVEQPGLAWHEIPDAPEPAMTERKLFDQANALTKRFTAELEQRGKPPLPLQDKPLYAYTYAAGDRTLAGILTSFVVGSDPEVLLQLEVRSNRAGDFRWHCAGANYTGTAAFLLLDGTQVWSESPAKFGRTSVHRGWFPNQNLNLNDALAEMNAGIPERVLQLSITETALTQPEWASDGKSFVFHRNVASQGLAGATIGRLDLETRTVTDITNGCMPSLSPDGTQLVFSRVDAGVLRARADGTNDEILDEAGWAAAWSPNGQFIVWGARNNCTLLNVSTGQKRQLLTPQQSAMIDGKFLNISWSHDSRSIAFNVNQAGTNETIVVVTDIDDAVGFRILFTGNAQPDITWHADNRQVIFALAVDQGAKRLHIMDRHTDEFFWPLPGLPTGFRIQDCALSADGRRIVFTALAPATIREWTTSESSVE